MLLSRVALADDVVSSALPETVTTSPRPLYSKRLAATAFALTYATIGTWAYFAWFYGKKGTDHPLYTLEGFGVNTYAGGADKCGHFWGSYMLSRVTTEALVAGGWRRLPSSLVAVGISQVIFTLSEVKDSFIYQFEYGDIIANVSGAGFALLTENVPIIDRLFDFRLQYIPSREYLHLLRHGNIDGFQDYSGQSYMLAMHLSGIPGFVDQPWGWWGRYVDVVLGFETRNYAPQPDDLTQPRYQRLYGGIALNMQGVLRSLFKDSTGRRLGIGAFEFVSIPGTTFRYFEASRNGTPYPVMP
jgi:hypothetical protein